MSSPIYQKALETFGHAPQLNQAQEEAAEFIVAVNHFRRGRGGAQLALAAEIADLEIMLAQVRLILGADAAIDRLKNEKLVRLSRLISTKESGLFDAQGG